MMDGFKKTATRPGAAAVELAVVLPVFFTLLVGIWEVGRLVQVQELLTSAVREGGRQATTGQMANTDVQKVVLHHLNNEGIQVTDSSDNPLSGVVVTVVNNTKSGVDASQANKLDSFTVSVTVPFNLLSWSTINKFTSSDMNMTASVTWFSMRNAPFTMNQTIPTVPQ